MQREAAVRSAQPKDREEGFSMRDGDDGIGEVCDEDIEEAATSDRSGGLESAHGTGDDEGSTVASTLVGEFSNKLDRLHGGDSSMSSRSSMPKLGARSKNWVTTR